MDTKNLRGNHAVNSDISHQENLILTKATIRVTANGRTGTSTFS